MYILKEKSIPTFWAELGRLADRHPTPPLSLSVSLTLTQHNPSVPFYLLMWETVCTSACREHSKNTPAALLCKLQWFDMKQPVIIFRLCLNLCLSRNITITDSIISAGLRSRCFCSSCAGRQCEPQPNTKTTLKQKNNTRTTTETPEKFSFKIFSYTFVWWL